MPEIPVELAPLYRPSVPAYLASWLPIDPAAKLSHVKEPVWVIDGTTELQVGVDRARRLAAARPGAELVLIEGMNHILKHAPSDYGANLATYADSACYLRQGCQIPPQNF